MNTQQLYDQYAEARAESEHPAHSPTRRAQLGAWADSLEVRWQAAELYERIKGQLVSELDRIHGELREQLAEAERHEMWLELQADQLAFARQW